MMSGFTLSSVIIALEKEMVSTSLYSTDKLDGEK